MGILSNLFRGKKASSELPEEVSRVFKKLAELLENEDLQNSMYNPILKEQITDGLNVDQLPHGIGEFGRSLENPIPVNGGLGELVYLSLLRTEDTKQRLLFHRLGSAECIDVYETVSIDGEKWDILFLSMYHPRKSRKTPTGYFLTDPRSLRLLYGTNTRVNDFPYGLQNAIRQTTKDILGIPLRPPEVRKVEESIQFHRPKGHEERFQKALANLDFHIT